ncbi:MAG: hypothetical protein IKL25_02575, partial [Clostridia bacterium]|nr:hypothetical protein [Clostridia bacterium]
QCTDDQASERAHRAAVICTAMEMWCVGFFQTTVRMYKSARAKTHHCQQRTNQTPILHAIGKGWFRHIASPFLLDC